MKKILSVLFAIASLGALNARAADTLVVGATAIPHAEILEFVKPQLAKEGVNLEIQVFTDYVQPNVRLVSKDLDANYFQHKPYLEEFNKSHNTSLVPVAGIHIEPFGIYSDKYKTLADVPDGAQVAIPNDPTNGGRALLLLQKNGLIKLKDPTSIIATPSDVVDNPKHLQIIELEAAMLPRVLKQMDLACINTNYALQANLNPQKDALAIESSDSPYVNVLVARPDNANSPAMQKLAAAMTSPETKKFIEDKYHGAIVPAF